MSNPYSISYKKEVEQCALVLQLLPFVNAAAHFLFAIEHLCVLFFLRSKTHLCVSNFWQQVISMFIGIKKKIIVLCVVFLF